MRCSLVISGCVQDCGDESVGVIAVKSGSGVAEIDGDASGKAGG